MNLRQLEAFVTVALNKSFSETAKELFISQPSVSGYISALEEELKVKLFTRTTKAIALTEAGEELFVYAKQIVDLNSLILDRFKVSEKSSLIRIGASSIPSRYILPNILAKFREENPHSNFSVREKDSQSVIDAVSEGRIDVGFSGAIIKKRHIDYQKLMTDEIVVITPNSKNYKDKIKKKDLSWIMDEPILIREPGSGTRMEAMRVLKEQGIDVNKLNIIAEMENTETIKRSVRDGMGISFISKLATREGVSSGNVLDKSISDENQRWLYMVTNSKLKPSSSATEFAEFVKRMYKS